MLHITSVFKSELNARNALKRALEVLASDDLAECGMGPYRGIKDATGYCPIIPGYFAAYVTVRSIDSMNLAAKAFEQFLPVGELEAREAAHQPIE